MGTRSSLIAMAGVAALDDSVDDRCDGDSDGDGQEIEVLP